MGAKRIENRVYDLKRLYPKGERVAWLLPEEEIGDLVRVGGEVFKPREKIGVDDTEGVDPDIAFSCYPSFFNSRLILMGGQDDIVHVRRGADVYVGREPASLKNDILVKKGRVWKDENYNVRMNVSLPGVTEIHFSASEMANTPMDVRLIIEKRERERIENARVRRLFYRTLAES